MREIKHINALTAGVLVAASILMSCDKNLTDRNDVDKDASNSAYVKVFNLSGGATRNFVFVDGKPVSGVQMLYGETLPAHSSGYGIKLTAGLHSFVIRDTLATATQLPLNFNGNFEANKSYSIFMYDTTVRVKQVTVPNNFDIPTDTTSRIRFGNFYYQTTPGNTHTVDLYSSFFGRRIFTNVAPSQVTDFIVYPGALPSGDTLRTYIAGTNTQVSQLVAYTTTMKRSYTIVARGNVLNINNTNGTGPAIVSYTNW